MNENKNKYQPQEDYAKRQGWKVFGYKIDKELGEKFRAECITRGTSQAREIEKLIGRTWGSLTTEMQEELLSLAEPWEMKIPGDCIIDFMNTKISIQGYLQVNDDSDEYIINDNAIFYNSEN